MPSHKIHFLVAKKVNETLKCDLDSIMLGSVLPDLTNEKIHELSHYQQKGSYEDRLANPQKFIKKYKSKLKNPVILGYLIHLLTDRYYNDYIFKNYCNFDKFGEIKNIKLKNGKIKDNVIKYKKSDLVKYDKWLLKSKKIPKFLNFDCLNNVENLDEVSFDKNYLKDYVTKANFEVDKPKKYKIKSSYFYKVMTKNELDNLLDSCVIYILDYINDVCR